MAFGGQEFSATVTTVGGYGWCQIPSGAGDVISVVVQFTADASRMGTPPLNAIANVAGKTSTLNDAALPVFMGTSPTATGLAPQGVLQFGPGCAPAPDGTYNVKIFTT